MAVPNPPPALPARLPMLGWAVLYAAVVLYASTLVNLGTAHPVQLSWGAAVTKFLATGYVEHGSDQRADWTANLLMIVPLGFMLTGALWPRRSVALRVPAGMAALAICVAYVLAVKFAQVFYPRTVTINYIIAQCCGAAIGVLLFAGFHARLARAVAALRRGGRRGLIVLLAGVSVAGFAYTLVPFDIVVSGQDLAERLAALPQVLLALPGAGRSVVLRLALLVGGMLLGVPFGMLLEIWRPGRPAWLIFTTGIFAMAALMLPALLVIGAAPALVAIPLRAGGMLAGALALRGITARDLAGLRPALRRAAPWVVVPYGVALLALNGLLNTHWRAPAEAWSVAGDPRRFLPLFTYYNISKAQAAASLVVHVAMYAPVGAWFWAMGWEARRHLWYAALTAVALAGAVEIGRSLQPGLPPEINNIWVAALAAGLGAVLAPFVWRQLVDIAREQRAPPRRASLARYM